LILSGLHPEAKPEFRPATGILGRIPFEWLLIALPIFGQLALVVLVLLNLKDTGLASFCWASILIAALSSLLLVVVYGRTVRWRLRSFAFELARLAGTTPVSKGSDEITNLEHSCCALAESLSEAIEREYAIADYALEFIGALDQSGKFIA